MPAESPFRPLTDTPRVNEQLLLDETKSTWGELDSTPITDEDAREISTNMSAFLALLIDWDVATQSSTILKSKKKARTRTIRSSPSTGPATL